MTEEMAQVLKDLREMREEQNKIFENLVWLCKQVQAAMSAMPPGMLGRKSHNETESNA